MDSIKTYIIKVFILTLMSLNLMGVVGLAQDINGLYAKNNQVETLEIEAGTTLQQALEKIRNRFNVVFLYGTTTIQKKN